MVTLKCKICASTDVTATESGFVCEKCKTVYTLSEISELFEKEAETADEEKTEPESCRVEFSKSLNAKKDRKVAIKIIIGVAAVVLVWHLGFWIYDDLIQPEIYKAKAEEYYIAGDYEQAYDYYSRACDSQGMERAVAKGAYSYAEKGDIDKAVEFVKKITDANASEKEFKKVCYKYAEYCIDKGEKENAAVYFGKAIGYSDAKERSFGLWDDIAVRVKASQSFWYYTNIDIGWIMSDGTVEAKGENQGEEHTVYGLDDIISIAVFGDEIVGLRSDGTLVSTSAEEDYSEHENVVGIYNQGGFVNNLVILYADGTVNGIFLLGDYAGYFDTIIHISDDIFLKSDGTVVTCEDYAPYVKDWSDVVDVTSTTDAVFALKSDGTVLSADKNGNAVSEVASWRNIKNISSDGTEALGLKENGTVVSTKADSKFANESGIIDMHESAGGTVLETANGFRY